MSRILNFSDQDSSRDAVLRICSKFTVESIAAIDSAIGIEVDEDSTEAESYKEFLAWLGPHLCQMAQSHVVGPLLSSITYEGEGVISVSSDLPAIELHRDELYTRRGRVGWLVEEIPSLIEHYGQLYEDEVPQALRDCEKAAEIDWSADNALTANAELFNRLRLGTCSPSLVTVCTVGMKRPKIKPESKSRKLKSLFAKTPERRTNFRGR